MYMAKSHRRRRVSVSNVGRDSNNACILKIHSVYPSLSKALKKAADYIIEHPQEVASMSISQLAEKSGVSEFSIVKLCHRLSYKGYTELRLKLVQTDSLMLHDIYEEVEENDTPYEVARKLCNSHRQALESTLKVQDQSVLEEAAKILATADTLLFFGFAGSACVASDAEHKFFRTGAKCRAVHDGHMQAMLASLLTPKDVVVAFSNTGSTKELLDNLEVARQSGAKIIAVTCHSQSPVARIADLVIPVSAVETAYRTEPMEVRIAMLYIVDILFTAVALRKKDLVFDNLTRTRKALFSKRASG